LIVGGMPQIVVDYIKAEKNVMFFNRDLLDYLRLSYLADMNKYVTNAVETAKISAVYDSIPRQLAKANPKFKYKEIKSTAIKRDYYAPIDWLNSSGMIYKINRLETIEKPIKAYENTDCFKIYVSDVGLLCKICGLNPNDLSVHTHNIYKGAIVENYVFQQMMLNYKEMYYYKPNESMEIDLITMIGADVIPVEIKSGRHKKSTSLKNYMKHFKPQYSIRISENNFGIADNIKSVPLYAVFCIK
jgi:predicted AAA+ superfamily ATPase